MTTDEKIHSTRSTLLNMLATLTMENGFSNADLAKLHIDSAVYCIEAIWTNKEQ